MNILVVHYEDDNFGDNLINNCFVSLLKVVLKNLNIAVGNENGAVSVTSMSIKKPDRERIVGSDIIFFAGGGLFGLSYLNFFQHLDEIISIADEADIPVVFSSMGINNMDVTSENEEKLKDILKKKCIKAVSVRENIDLFLNYTENPEYQIELVCDPAVWAQFVYKKEADAVRKGKTERVVGINVVRGRLFKDNDKQWNLGDELKYLDELRQLLDENNMEYRFFTNGNFLDNNTLKYFAKEYNVPADKLIMPYTSRGLAETVAGFDFVAAIRMHASILSYSMEIPSVNLIWNDKIPLFYEYIGRPDYAIPLEEWSADRVADIIKSENDKLKHDQSYLMSLYNYLYNTMLHICGYSGSEYQPYDFERVCLELSESEVPVDSDLQDMRVRIDRSQYHYLGRFVDVRNLEKELKLKNKTIENNNQKIQKKETEIEKLKKQNEEAKKESDKLRKEGDKLQGKNDKLLQENDKLKSELKNKKETLDRFNRQFIVRVLKKLRIIKR